MNRRSTALLSALLMLGTLSGCGNSDSSDEAVTTTAAATEATTEAPTSADTTTTERPTETTAQTEAATSEPENDPADSAATRVVLDVENIPMLPELPTGSAIASAAMVLNYYGIECDKMDLLEYLPMSKRPADHNAAWADPTVFFCGDPSETVNSFGSTSAVIIKMINDYLSANKITNYIADWPYPDLDDLIVEISNGNPVIIWATVNMKKITGYEYWNANNGIVEWPLNSHCVVLLGYDTKKDTLIVNDPLKGIVEYPWKTVFEVYYAQYSDAVVIHKK